MNLNFITIVYSKIKPAITFLFWIFISIFVIFILWFAVCHDKSDSKGPRYIMWKVGLWPFDPEVVYRSMVTDRNRDALVIGLTAKELEIKFGLLRNRQTATKYQRFYSDQYPKEQEIAWLGDSAWMVIFENGRVIVLCLEKG